MRNMRPRSLRFRLYVAALISIFAALLIAGMSLVVIFEHHVERRIGTELETYLNQITASVELDETGRITFNQPLADPRFNQPLSGLYWQIRDEVRPTLLRSRSLWDSVIELPVDELATGIIHKHIVSGPAAQVLLVRERHVTFQATAGERRLRIAVAVTKQSLSSARNEFAADMLPYLLVMVTVLLLASWIQIRTGLAPLTALRRGVKEVRAGEISRLEPAYPEEVMPLVDEVNGLLDVQEQTIERARAWTSDLAHGLKTPLMVLTSEAMQMREAGNPDGADRLEELAETMRRRVDRELIRARLRSGVQQRPALTDCEKIIRGIVRTLKRISGGEGLEWDISVPERVFALVPPDDLSELFGNLLENATKWARKTISVGLVSGDPLVIRIEDDGPGVPEDQLNSLGLRGLRLDEQKQGSGLGLAIAFDITRAYGGELVFERSTLGGLAVNIRLPGPGPSS